jgi:ubiquinone/menaquinone biosynthesis C-methylase UbiE
MVKYYKELMLKSNSYVIKVVMDERLLNEIEHGKKIAGSAGDVWNWTSPAGKLRWARRVTMLTSQIKAGSNVLEIGCGTGFFTKELAKINASITAVDISPDLISIAQAEIKSPNVKFVLENAYQTKFADESFDYVIGSSVLHHLDVDQALKEFHRLLKKNGTLIFTEPNMLNPQIFLQKNIPYLKKKLGDSPDEKAFFKWSISKKLQEYGFSVKEVSPFDFLHPSIPEKGIPFLAPLCKYAEQVVFLKEIAGSLFIQATRNN